MPTTGHDISAGPIPGISTFVPFRQVLLIGTTATLYRNPPSSENMSMRDSTNGLFGLVSAIVCAGFCITLVTGTFSHWPVLALGIGVGLWAVRIMERS